MYTRPPHNTTRTHTNTPVRKYNAPPAQCGHMRNCIVHLMCLCVCVCQNTLSHSLSLALCVHDRQPLQPVPGSVIQLSGCAPFVVPATRSLARSLTHPILSPPCLTRELVSATALSFGCPVAVRRRRRQPQSSDIIFPSCKRVCLVVAAVDAVRPWRSRTHAL